MSTSPYSNDLREKVIKYIKSGGTQAYAVKLFDLNASIANYQTEIYNLKTSTKLDEQDAFIDRLFKQIDLLNDEKLSLLSEKEEMAIQLLKMNESVPERMASIFRNLSPLAISP